MKGRTNQKIITIPLIFVLLFVLNDYQVVLAQENQIIVSVVDIELPPRVMVYEENYTVFQWLITYQVENPTNTNIVVDYLCVPIAFPHFIAYPEDDILDISLVPYIEWVAGSKIYTPGIIEEGYYVTVVVDQYSSEIFPYGSYEIWFNFTGCSYSPVPVIVKKLKIEVNKIEMIYLFEYNNSSQIVELPQQTSPSPTNSASTNSASINLFISFFSIPYIIKLKMVCRKLCEKHERVFQIQI